MRNGLTAEGLASPFVRVTRLCKVVPPSSQHPNQKGENTASRRRRTRLLSSVGLPSSCRSPPLRSIITHNQKTVNWGDKSDLPAKQGAMKDRMQELRHVSYCFWSFWMLDIHLLWLDAFFLLSKSVFRRRRSSEQDALMEQQLWLSGSDGGWNVVFHCRQQAQTATALHCDWDEWFREDKVEVSFSSSLQKKSFRFSAYFI